MAQPQTQTSIPPRWQTALTKAADLMDSGLRYVGTQDGTAVFAADSATNPAVAYIVRVRVRDGRTQARCTCTAAQYHRPCWHVAAAVTAIGRVPLEAA